MSQQPLVSILITAYNREKYIGAAIESVLSLTYINFELIITDDCSIDQTFIIAKSYEVNDSRIRVFKNEINLGDYGNRNRAALYAKGKYLKYLDADDLIYPYSLNVMVEAMEKFPEAGLGLEEPFYDKQSIPFPYLKHPIWIYTNHFLKKGVIYVGPSAAIIRTDFFREVGCFSGERYIGDTELWLKMASKAPVVFFQPALVFWRQHEGQEIVSENRNYDATLMRHNLNKHLIKNAGQLLTEAEKTLAIKKVNRRMIFNILTAGFKKNNLEESIYLYQKSKLTLKQIFQAVFH